MRSLNRNCKLLWNSKCMHQGKLIFIGARRLMVLHSIWIFLSTLGWLPEKWCWSVTYTKKSDLLHQTSSFNFVQNIFENMQCWAGAFLAKFKQESWFVILEKFCFTFCWICRNVVVSNHWLWWPVLWRHCCP